MRKIIYACYFMVFIVYHGSLSATSTPVIKEKFGTLQTIVLRGSYEQMGRQYGESLHNELKQVLAILKDFYITKQGLSYIKLKDHANLLFDRFPIAYQRFIHGISEGSGLTFDDVKILNAMETFEALLAPHDAPQGCSFLSLPANKTKKKSLLLGRNYDYPPPFDQLSKYLTITVLQDEGTVPSAFISIAGEIYCATCINANGLFIELNNGMPSGGFEVAQDRESLLINLLRVIQNSSDMQQMNRQLNDMHSDLSLIINTADHKETKSYEFSSTLGVMKTVLPAENKVFASTNFFLNKDWHGIPKPSDASTWQGVKRRNNLLTLAHQSNNFNIASFKQLMDKSITEGGAVLHTTIYQLIYDPKDLVLYVKINNQGDTWNKIPLKKLFS